MADNVRDCASHARDLANLIDPAKLAPLGPRGANPRIQKSVALLEDARRDGCPVATVASNAVFIAGCTNAILVQMTRAGRFQRMVPKGDGY